jgi:drug/metabolite transporter (DMT)-like permease
VASVLLAPLAAVTTARQGISLSPTRAAAIGLLGVFGTGVAYVLSYRLIADVGPTRASLVTYLVPVVAVAVGVVFLHEAFALRLLAGGVLVVGGIALVDGAGAPKPRPVAPGAAFLGNVRSKRTGPG